MARNLLPDQIPKGWSYKLLDDVAERCSGHTPSKSFPEYWNGGIKWISLADTFRLDKGLVHETDKEISKEGISNSSAQLHPAGTVVLSRDAGIGKSGIMAEPMAVSQHFIAWKCDNEKMIDSWFLYNWLQLHKPEFERQAVGSTIKTIGLPFFKKLKIATPPFEEQRKIAKILSTWDKAISTTERLIDNSKQQKKALMQQLLTGKKRLLDDSGRVFEGEWEEKVLKDLCEKVIDNRGKTPPLVDEGLPLVEINSIVDTKHPILTKVTKFVSSETFKTWFRNGHPTCGDILVATVGSAGVSALVDLDEGFGSIAQNLIALRPNKKVDNSFLYYMVNTPYFFSLVRAVVMGAVQPSLKVPHLLNFKISLPKITEQQKIASVLTAADQEIELLEQQLADLKQEKKALMQQLLTGKRRVKLDDTAVA